MPFIGNLNPATPTGSDLVSLGDDEFRALKQTLVDSFPGLDSQPWQKADATFQDECATLGQTQQLIRDVFPVGYVLFTATNSNPGSTFSGTWTQIAQGRFLVGVGQGTDASGNVRTYPEGNDTVGEYTHTLTVSELASHSHIIPRHAWGDPRDKFSYAGQGAVIDPNFPTDDAGGDQPHENSPPGFGLYVWQRTA